MPKIVMDLVSNKPESEIWNYLENNLETLLSKKVPTEKIEAATDKAARVVVFKGRTVSGLFSSKDGIFNLEIEVPLLYRSFISNIKRAIKDLWQTI